MNLQLTQKRYHMEKQERDTSLEANEKIILLTNSVLYFLDFVFIIIEKETFRLVVLHRNRTLTDYRYRSLRGAKIAFSKIYIKMCCRKDVKPRWTCAYHPDSGWLEDKLNKKNKREHNIK